MGVFKEALIYAEEEGLHIEDVLRHTPAVPLRTYNGMPEAADDLLRDDEGWAEWLQQLDDEARQRMEEYEDWCDEQAAIQREKIGE